MVIGVDEVGRGCWAGPVVTAAVRLHEGFSDLPLLKDSKKLSEKSREACYGVITSQADWAIGMASPREIDRLNIRQATLLAMYRAVTAVPGFQSDAIMVDGRDTIPGLNPARCTALIQGEDKEPAIAAASIIAKVFRDRLMAGYMADVFPQYSFGKHKGYGTAVHMEALRRHGGCEQHRLSFKPLKQFERQE